MPIPADLFEKCWPVLADAELDDDDRADQLQDLVRSERPLFTAEEVEQTVLDALWKHRTMTSENIALSNIPQTRLSRLAPGVKAAPLPRQPFVIASTPKQTPTGSRSVSRQPSGLLGKNNNGSRPTTATHSPAFGSPYLTIATPVAGPIPNSPTLSGFVTMPRELDGSYSWRQPLSLERQKSAEQPYFDEQDDGHKDLTKDGDLRNHSADWFLDSDDEDDVFSNFSSLGGRVVSNVAIFPATDEDGFETKRSQQYLVAQQEISALSPHDQVRYCFGLHDEYNGGLSDKELETLLDEHSYDLVATLDTLVKKFAGGQPSEEKEEKKAVVVGKSMSANSGRPLTPSGKRPQTPASTAIGSTVCRYWLATGNCRRADCKYSHDPSTVLCKYWLTSECMAPDGCIFSHNPIMSLMMASARTEHHAMSKSSALGFSKSPAQDFVVGGGYDTAFPALGLDGGLESRVDSPSWYLAQQRLGTPTHGQSSKKKLNPLANFTPSRPTSQNTSRAGTPGPVMNITPVNTQDKDAFPALRSSSKSGRHHHHHHGKRSYHGHDHHDSEGKSRPIRILARPSEDTAEVNGSPVPEDDANKKKTRRGPRKSKRNVVLNLPLRTAADTLDDS